MIKYNDLKELKIAYEENKLAGNNSFLFKEQELLTSYVKYLIEHLENDINKIKNN